MDKLLPSGDRDFCRMYGAHCYRFYGTQSWASGLPTFQAGWLRVSNPLGIAWRDAEAEIYAGWTNASIAAEPAASA